MEVTVHRLGWGGLVLFVSVGCGGGQTYHCDFRTSEAPEDRCQERRARVAGAGALTSEAFIQTCELAQGDGADGPCPVDDAVAGCDVSIGVGGETVVDWFYPPETRTTVEVACDGTVVDP